MNMNIVEWTDAQQLVADARGQLALARSAFTAGDDELIRGSLAWVRSLSQLAAAAALVDLAAEGAAAPGAHSATARETAQAWADGYAVGRADEAGALPVDPRADPGTGDDGPAPD